jgi:hypothetical protein
MKVKLTSVTVAVLRTGHVGGAGEAYRGGSFDQFLTNTKNTKAPSPSITWFRGLRVLRVAALC